MSSVTGTLIPRDAAAIASNPVLVISSQLPAIGAHADNRFRSESWSYHRKQLNKKSMELKIPAHHVKFFEPTLALPAFGQKDPCVTNEHLRYENLDEG